MREIVFNADFTDWRRIVNSFNPCSQNRFDLVVLGKEKQIRGSSRKLCDECRRIEAEPHDSIGRVFIYRRDWNSTKLVSEDLGEPLERNGLFFQFSCAAPNQVNPWTRRIEADKQKLTAQSEIECQ